MARKNGNEMGPNKQILSRTLVLMGVCGIFTFVILAVQLFRLQIVEHEEYEQLAIEQQVRETTVTANRGTIYDATGTILAKSASVENVFISPNSIMNYDEDKALIASGLSRILDVDEDSILEKMENTDSHYQTIKTKVEQEEADQVREFLSENEIKSVFLEPATKRYYPKESTAAHVLGFVGSDETGMGYGVEGSYDSYLTGTNGRIVRLKSSNGVSMLNQNYEDYYVAEDGDDVYLTLDVNIQKIMEKYLEQAVEDYDLQDGAFSIAMNPKTGAILGMVSIDGYDPNNYSSLDEETLAELRALYPDDEEYEAAVLETVQESWRNKAINYTYEPGSTFKLITLAIALEEGLVSEEEGAVYYCSGHTEVAGRTSSLNCWKDGGHGSQTLTQVIQHSCNVGTVEIAMRIGPEKYYEYLEAFGFFETTGIDLSGESTGMIWSEEDWYSFIENGNYSSLAAASFGQTLTVSPMQLVTAIGALANGGDLVQPYVVDKIVAADGSVSYENTTVVKRQVISEETSQKVMEIAEQVVGDPVEGTGKNAAVAGYRIGGKTGTSTNTVKEAEEDVKEYILSFVSVAPTDDPEIVLLVCLQNPGENNGTYESGGQMAAPVAGKMLEEILPYLGIEPTVEGEDVQVNAQVPYVKKMTVADATAELEAEGFTVTVQGEGDQVADQLPAAGATVISGTEVILYMDEERPEEQVTVPDIVGMSYEDAKATLELSGLYVRRTGVTTSDGNTVVYKQSKDAGDVVDRGTVIEVSLIDQSDIGRY